MQRVFCDRCGKDITKALHCGLAYTYKELSRSNNALRFGDFEICDECNDQLRDWFYSIKKRSGNLR